MSRLGAALFGTRGHECAPEIVLLTRLIAVAWLLTGHAFLLPTRYVPFFAVLTPAATSPFVMWAGLVIGVGCTANLLLGRSVRASAITLGCVIFATTLLSRGYFSNNRLYTACVLLLAGLSPRDAVPRILRIQVALLYFGAGLDKLLDADWRSGAFVRSFAAGLAQHGRLWSPGADSRSPYAPARALSALVDAHPRVALVASVSTIAVELALGALFLLGARRAAIALGLAFHAGVLLYTGSPMGMFFYSATASYFAFVVLPGEIAIGAPPRALAWISALDPDGRTKLRTSDAFSLTVGNRTWSGAPAVLATLAHLPAFYVLLAALLAGPWSRPAAVLALLPALFLLPPFARRKKAAEVGHVTGELNP